MDIIKQIEIDVAPEKVYEAVTTPTGIRGWWSQDSDIASRTGDIHTMNFVKEGQQIVMKFRVDELQVGKKVKWTCVENGNPSWIGTTLNFEIDGEEQSTNLRFAHADWDQKYNNTPLYDSVAPTWQAFMGSLKNYCESGQGQPW